MNQSKVYKKKHPGVGGNVGGNVAENKFLSMKSRQSPNESIKSVSKKKHAGVSGNVVGNVVVKCGRKWGVNVLTQGLNGFA